MDIYETLSKDHRRYEALLDRMEQAHRSGNDDWKAALDELRDDLIPHAHAEEAVFYNALRETDQAKGVVADSYAEHAKAEAEVRALEAMKAVDKSWETGLKKLREDLTHHIQQEEGRVYQAARQVFSEEEARQLGEAFDRLKPEMRRDAESMAASTMDLVANLLPRRLVDAFRRNFGQGRKAA
jgi:hemerythrin superfamily protein